MPGQQLICHLLVSFVTMQGICGIKELKLLPNDPNFIVGRNITMECCRNATSSFTTDDITFEFHLLKGEPHHQGPVHRRYMSAKNKECVRLNFPNVSTNYNAATVSCICRRCDPQPSDHQIIRVGYEPERPVILSHIVHNWEDFVFVWRLSKTDFVYPTEYIAWFKTRDQVFKRCDKCDGGQTVLCPRQVQSTCIIPDALNMVHPHGLMEIKVNASNPVGRIESKPIKLDLFNHVKPAPVRNVRVTTSGSLPPVLHFAAPQPRPGWKAFDVLRYNITAHCSDGTTISYRIKSRSMENTRELLGLPPFTMCNVSVKCKPDYANLRNGYWSDIVSEGFRSQEAVPLSAPEICSSCFSINSNYKQSRDVILYFKSLDVSQARGIVGHYRLCSIDGSITEADSDVIDSCSTNVSSASNLNFLPADKTFIRLTLSPLFKYNLAVHAATAAGFNLSFPNLNGVTVPEMASS